MPSQVLDLASRIGLPDEQPTAAICRGQRLAVGTELGRINPIGMLANFMQQLAALCGIDADHTIRPAQRDQRLLSVDVRRQHGIQLVADLGDPLAALHIEQNHAARLSAAPTRRQDDAAVATETHDVRNAFGKWQDSEKLAALGVV